MKNTRHLRSVTSRQRTQRSAYLMQNKDLPNQNNTQVDQTLLDARMEMATSKKPKSTRETI